MKLKLGILGRLDKGEKDFALVVFVFLLVLLFMLIYNVYSMPDPVVLPQIYEGSVQELDEFQLMMCSYASNSDNCEKLDNTGVVSERTCCRLKEVCCT